MRTTNAIRLAYVADAVGRASEMSTMSETGNQMGFPIARKVGPAFVAMEPYHAENLTAGSRGNTSTRRQRPRRRNLAAKQIPLRLGSRWHFIPIPKTARADGARATHFVPSGPNPYSVAFVPSTLSAPNGRVWPTTCASERPKPRQSAPGHGSLLVCEMCGGYYGCG